MNVYEGIPQGTKEWNGLRAGMPTASQAHRIITPTLKPCGKSTHEKYTFQLLAERLMSEPATEKPQSFWWAERGKQLEVDAIAKYDLVNDTDSRPISFVVASCGRWGASPDRFIEPNGMAEFKCENEADHLQYVMQEGSLYEAHMLQVQMQLLTCEDREWDDLVAFHPKLPQAVHRTFRDKAVQDCLTKHLEPFCDHLDELWEECIRRGYAEEVLESRKKAFRPKTAAPSQLDAIDAVRQALIDVQK